MKLPPRCFLSIIVIFILVCLLFITALIIRHKNKNVLVVSPLPQEGKVLASWKEKKQEEQIWRPLKTPSFYNNNQLNLRTKSALSVDLTSGKVLFAQNANTPLPIASLTKIMTALVAQEIAPLNLELTVSSEATKEGEASMGLIPGEKLSLEELLYGLMLISGNDAANTIAENLGGRRQSFVALMNEKARLLNLQKTHFYNPNGLDKDGVPPNQSTTYNLAILTQYTLSKYPKMSQIIKTHEIIIPQNQFHQEYHLFNVLGLEKTYPGMIGGKPGNTTSAGYCLIDIAKNGGHEILGVLLNSPNPKEEIRQLFDFSFHSLGVKISGRNSY